MPTPVQNFTNSGYSVASNTATPGSAFGSGHTVVVFASSASVGVTGFTVTAPGLTFNPAGGFVSTAGGYVEQCFVAYGVPATAPTITVAATGATSDSTGYGTQLVGTEISGLQSSSTPFVQQASGENVFAAATATLTPTAGNIVITGSLDSFGGLTTPTVSAGTMVAGIACGYNADGRGGDYTLPAGGSAITITENGSQGYNIIIAVELKAAAASTAFDAVGFGAEV